MNFFFLNYKDTTDINVLKFNYLLRKKLIDKVKGIRENIDVKNIIHHYTKHQVPLSVILGDRSKSDLQSDTIFKANEKKILQKCTFTLDVDSIFTHSP